MDDFIGRQFSSIEDLLFRWEVEALSLETVDGPRVVLHEHRLFRAIFGPDVQQRCRARGARS